MSFTDYGEISFVKDLIAPQNLRLYVIGVTIDLTESQQLDLVIQSNLKEMIKFIILIVTWAPILFDLYISVLDCRFKLEDWLLCNL